MLSRARGRRRQPGATAARSSTRRTRRADAGGRRDDRARRSAASWSPAAPAPSARPSSTSCSTPASADVVVLDNLVRGRRANLDDALATGRVDARRGRHPRPRPGARPDPRQGPGLPPGRDPDHPVRRGAAAGPRGAGRRHLQRARGGRRSTASTRWSPRRRPRSTAWPSSSRPPSGTTTYNNDTFYGAAKSFNEGMLRSFHAMYGLDYVALRYFNVYGPRMDIHGLYTEVLIRWMERIADGAAAADLRRRPADDGLRLHHRHRPGQHARRRPATSPRGSTTSPAAPRPACSSWPQALLRAMDSDLGVEHGPERAVNGVDPAAGRHDGGRATTWASRPRSASRTGCASWSTWWRAAARGDRRRADARVTRP